MSHKRKRAKSRRAGCLRCKPDKLGQGMQNELGHSGFGKLRSADAAQGQLRDALTGEG